MKAVIYAVGAVSAVGLFLCLVACETESSTASVYISPSSTTIRHGQSIRFGASGGYDYEWSLQSDAWGYLSTRQGVSTVYTSTYNPETNATAAVQILSVESTISGTSATSYCQRAEAYIRHL